jgi:hypothetical protein
MLGIRIGRPWESSPLAQVWVAKGLPSENVPVSPVKHIIEGVPVRPVYQLARPTMSFVIHQDGNLCGIPVVHVMWYEPGG